MDRELERLTALARRIDAGIAPTRTEDGVVLTERDTARLVDAVNRATVSSMDGNRIKHLVGATRRRPSQVTLSAVEVSQLIGALDRFFHDVERDRKIRRGQYPGPMSGSEAVKFMRARRGL